MIDFNANVFFNGYTDGMTFFSECENYAFSAQDLAIPADISKVTDELEADYVEDIAVVIDCHADDRGNVVAYMPTIKGEDTINVNSMSDYMRDTILDALSLSK